MNEEFPKRPKHDEIEEKWRKKWKENEVFSYNPDSDKEVYSIDTPPPTVSGALHMGHAASYLQTEFIARYKRMNGYEVFYPMGFDDNGLPTERYVERKHGIEAHKTDKDKFIELCLKAAEEERKNYREVWERLGISVDWNQTYSTINEMSQRISQKSFIDLYNKNRAIKKKDAVIWCPNCKTAVAEAWVEVKQEHTHMNYLKFQLKDEDKAVEIATTRPELLGACVGIFINPEDERYQELKDKKAIVPLYDHEVPIMTDENVDMESGTGVMMVCTFGDKEDVEKWRKNNLESRIIIDKEGKLTEKAGKYQGMKVREAREKIVEDLEEKGYLEKREHLQHKTRVHERCGEHVEYKIEKTWFIKILDMKKELIERGEQVKWHPEHMFNRYEQWVENLAWDWSISRQRPFGVPFPVWECEECGKIKLPKEKELPVDPRQENPPEPCECGSNKFDPEKDVMDTWMTSSVTPLINAKWKEEDERMNEIYPMNLRPQSHDIIRTWAFYTITKSHLHTKTIPWEEVAISGYIKDEKGKGMSKSKGNIVDPIELIVKYSTDIIRIWSAGTKLGEDRRYREEDIKKGKQFLVKLWNASRFAAMHIEDYEPKEKPELEKSDKWILHELNNTIEKSTKQLEKQGYDKALAEARKFFWNIFCDYYLEMIKSRIYSDDEDMEESKEAAKYTLHHSLLNVLKLLAPFACFQTEELYHKIFEEDQDKSIHLEKWPERKEEWENEEAYKEVETAKEIIDEIRKWKQEKNMSIGKKIDKMKVKTPKAKEAENTKRIIGETMKVKDLKIEKGEETMVSKDV